MNAPRPAIFNSALSRWVLGWIPLWIATFFVFEGAILPPEKIPVILLQINDKLEHGTEYFFLFLFAANAFVRAAISQLNHFPLIFAFSYCCLIGGATEAIQFFAPGRYPDLQDWVADGLGASVAFVIVYALAKMLKVKAQ